MLYVKYAGYQLPRIMSLANIKSEIKCENIIYIYKYYINVLNYIQTDWFIWFEISDHALEEIFSSLSRIIIQK